MKKFIIILILLSGMVFANRAGLVVQSSSSTVIKKCVEFQNGESAFDILKKSGLGIATREYSGLGVALCKIGSVGCESSNCFCQSEYWGFYQMVAGNWEYSAVGIDAYEMQDGGVIGFRWGAYGDKPELHTFGEICPSLTPESGGGTRSRYFAIVVSGNCSNKPFVINVKEKEGGLIWEPTGFFLNADLVDIVVKSGVGIKVLLHQTYFGKDAGFEKVAVLFTDNEGNASFIPEKAGKYRLEFEKEGFRTEEAEIEINECREEVLAYKTVEELEPGIKTVEPNVTRVDIIAPESAEVNGTVTVKMLSEGGEPLVYESIIVDFPKGRKELITNESGEATFNATYEGVYSYSSPNYLLSSFKVTNIIKPVQVSLESRTQVAPGAENPPSVGMATAGISPEILGVGVIIVIGLLFLIQKVMD